MKINKKLLLGSMIITTLALTGCQTMMSGMGMIPMGSSTDQEDAANLWAVLKQNNLVGNNMKRVRVYPGSPPHGKILETLHQQVTVNGYTGLAIIKRNYGGPGVSTNAVKSNPGKYLKAVTVMFKREAGYDPEDKNWFWAKYKPNGSLHTKPKMGMDIPLAGRVAKGKDEGCISCHKGAPGGDFVFAQDISL
ncbi:hypothetical protein MNBD_GAMMA07-1100 [hydrothermal vent metagenome]|uniref:Cytochrome P460 domain-containing protein n=1 Tax=hydrothermal vent metagenome TaxID=652676 RepID=A0A3B0X441_9ZZZZ